MAGLLAPDRPVGHHFELLGWTLGIPVPDRLRVSISGRPASLAPAGCPGAPVGAQGFRVAPGSAVPVGTHRVVLEDDERVLAECVIRVGSLPDEPPLWLGELEAPRPEQSMVGHVVLVVGWALL